ncbi:phage tail protein [Pseudonocardia xinjiangensis]|jgi:phage tail-like protein|uniref:Phage tail protein n=1 Tax=Pseudonocardia xinjiangensis TaxID=75289 RepID=A0ABX1RLF7_9PSEU|nr:phage tail protein [Pseudonocardia xinjiangensis]NMH81198.1 phage tail protein [Pseudonocardia xinjiangensis]
MPPTTDPGSTVFFKLSIDGQDFGLFTSCEGFSVQAEAQQHQEGGNNSFTWHLPGRINYSNIRLSRPINSDSNQANQWMEQSMVTTLFTRPTAEITAMNPDGSELCTWGLNEVTPVSWQGPTFNPDSPGVATETLELAYHGFSLF